ncbi:MAG TPA: amidohydrolase family protein [Candidatus Acidoferrales bacterium]|nr:amidohydrolase family protein [Candidatus Acidoferrales bacterium]
MRIDIHNHTTPAAYLEAVKRDPDRMGSRVEIDDDGRRWLVQGNGKRTEVPENAVDVSLRLREMADAQIDVVVESIRPTQLHYWADAATAVRVCRTVNDAIAEDAARYPDRIVGMAMLPMQSVKEAVAELDRIVRELKMPAVMIGTNVNDRNLDEPEFLPFFERARDHGVLVFIHPHEVTASSRLRRYYLTNLIGNPLETTIAIASLIFGGVLEKLPELKLCFAHAGGYAPWIRGRWRHGQAEHPTPRKFLPRPLEEYFRLLYFDTVIFEPDAIEYLIRVAGSDHVLLGTDYPAPMGALNQVSMISGLKSLSAQDKEKVLGQNAARLLGLESSKHR